jgi:hypothetical protein
VERREHAGHGDTTRDSPEEQVDDEVVVRGETGDVPMARASWWSLTTLVRSYSLGRTRRSEVQTESRTGKTGGWSSS